MRIVIVTFFYSFLSHSHDRTRERKQYNKISYSAKCSSRAINWTKLKFGGFWAPKQSSCLCFITVSLNCVLSHVFQHNTLFNFLLCCAVFFRNSKPIRSVCMYACGFWLPGWLAGTVWCLIALLLHLHATNEKPMDLFRRWNATQKHNDMNCQKSYILLNCKCNCR